MDERLNKVLLKSKIFFFSRITIVDDISHFKSYQNMFAVEQKTYEGRTDRA